MMDLGIKRALITGASSGIGAEFARQLAREGYDLILVARREDRMASLGDALQQEYGIHYQALPADLVQEAGIQRVEARLEKGEVGLLVNNAGFGLVGTFSEIELDKHIAMNRVHMTASMRLIHAALPGMLDRDKGGIINVASMAAFIPLRNVSYAATKAYLVTFSEALSNELYRSGVHIQALCPGFTTTEFHDNRDLSQFRRSQIPSPLWSKVEDVVAESLRALARDQVICVPGFLYKVAAALAGNNLTYPLLKAIALRISRKKP
jgi:short-subunit dehydrogenase